MITLSQMIILIIVIAIIAAFACSGKLRAAGKALGNKLIEDKMATPEGAEAMFNQRESEVEDKFRTVDGVYKKIAGQRKRCRDELESLKSQLTVIESQCEKLAKNQDMEGLDIKADERADVVEDINLHEETLKSLEIALKDASEARAAVEENLAEIRKKKKQIVGKMKLNSTMKDIYADLEGIGAGDETSKLLNRVIEKGTDLEDTVAGSKEAYETRTSTKAKKVNQRLKTSANDDYKQALLNKYKK